MQDGVRKISLGVLLIGIFFLVMVPPGCNVVAEDITYVDTLRFTIPGDNGMQGRASHYDLRYSLDGQIDDGNWHLATPITPMNVREDTLYPGIAGEMDSAYVEIIVPSDAIINFAIKAGDEVINWAQTSNNALGVAEDVDPPAQITDLVSLRNL